MTPLNQGQIKLCVKARPLHTMPEEGLEPPTRGLWLRAWSQSCPALQGVRSS